jgi:acyl-CoA thioester hydrolase
MKSILTTRVRYKETDKMGRVYHANYFVWFDMARTEYLREAGVSYKEMEEQGVFFVVADTSCKYKAGLEFDDWVEIETNVREIRNASVSFEYSVHNKTTRVLIANASTTLAAVDKNGKVVPIPAQIKEKLHVK